MFKNYFKIAIRGLLKNRTYSLINLLGLTFGLTCFMLIGLYLFDELTFDQQHANVKRIYRVVEHKKTNNENLTIAAGSFLLAEEAKKRIPEVENTARFTRTGRANMRNPENDNTFYQTVTIANNGFMELFDFEAVAGDPKTALKEPNSIVIVEDLAKQFFNKVDVVGKMVKWDFMETPLKITAVIKNHPRNSSFDFTSLYSEATIMSDTGFANRAVRDWSSENYTVYALLRENADPAAVSQKMTQVVKENATAVSGSSVSFSLQPLKDIHLHSEGIVDGARNSNVDSISNGSLFYIKIFGLVALFVLFIACINYMNLTTAKASSRSKEIGIRKTSGAYRGELIRQFMLESILISLFSFLLAVSLVNLLLPAFNQFTNKELTLGYHTDYRVWLYSTIAALFTGIVSGSYPAFVLSGFNPVLLIKGVKLQSRGDLSLRKGLVVFQFTISVIMIIATLVLFLQIRYINSKDLGFNRDLLLVVDINSGKVRNGAAVVNSEFSKIPHVKSVSTTSRVPGEWKVIPTIKMRTAGNTQEYNESYFLGVDEHFSNTFEVKLLKGRNFNGMNDTSSVILNESAAKILNITEPSGQIVEIPMMAFGGSYSNLRNGRVFNARVIGIVKDFHFQSLREKIAPLVMGYQYNPVHVIDYFTAKIDGRDANGTLTKMKEVLAKIDINHLFEYHYLDQQLAVFYQEDVRRQKILIWAALAAVFIACMGLFGLATYAAEQRVKEIGVRKVLGASVGGITALLSKDFVKLVLISVIVGSPVAYLLMNTWLQEFAYRIRIEWWVFLVSGITAVTIALFTVSFQAIKAAIANPVKSLRTE
jgi:putative ABC transport system permease protein